MHTPEQLRQTADAIEASKRDEPCEYYFNGQWNVITDQWHAWSAALRYRPASKPATRPWNCAEDVPMNCWVSGAHKLADYRFAVMAATPDGISIADHEGPILISWDRLADRQYTIDGKTFHPCTVPA